MLFPFSEGVQSGGVISYGLSHAGYDLRLGKELWVFKNSYNEIVNPKKFKDEEYRRRVFDIVTPNQVEYPYLPLGAFVIPGHSYALGASFEHIHIPKHIKGRCVGKSTLARCGILINTTPLEPNWKGHLTIEISNISPCPAIVFAMEGIAQLEFELLSSLPEIDYEAKGGKYQSQGSYPVPARVKE
jgi:dCTP deaminase